MLFKTQHQLKPNFPWKHLYIKIPLPLHEANDGLVVAFISLTLSAGELDCESTFSLKPVPPLASNHGHIILPKEECLEIQDCVILFS